MATRDESKEGGAADASNAAKKAMGETKISVDTCKLPSFCKRWEDDHNSCLAKCDLNGTYAMILFILSIFGMGGISMFCYMCCSKQENAPRWIWKNFVWLNIWMGIT